MFAALAVVAFHYQPMLAREFPLAAAGLIELPARYGYLGVDLFFLISGYVIVMSATGRTVRSFLTHRIARLYPSFWVALALLVGARVIASPVDAWPPMENVVANATMLPGYLGQPRLDDVYWTLAVEWKFYVLVALSLAIGALRHFEPIALIWTLLIGVQLLGFNSSLLQSVTIFPYGGYFAFGMILFSVREHGFSRLRSIALALGVPTRIAIALRVMPNFVHQQRTYDILVVALAVASMLGFMTFIVARKNAITSSPRLLFLGALTYPLYLIHSVTGRILVANWNPFESRAASVVCSVGLVFAVSALTGC